jgi:hypothetical protein
MRAPYNGRTGQRGCLPSEAARYGAGVESAMISSITSRAPILQPNLTRRRSASARGLARVFNAFQRFTVRTSNPAATGLS